MDLFDDLFDFDDDGDIDELGEELGLSIVLPEIENDEPDSASVDDYEFGNVDDADFADLDEDEFETGFERIESLREKLFELEEQLSDLESRKPDDILSARYERWKSGKEQLEDRISDLNNKIFDLELEYEV